MTPSLTPQADRIFLIEGDYSTLQVAHALAVKIEQRAIRAEARVIELEALSQQLHDALERQVPFSDGHLKAKDDALLAYLRFLKSITNAQKP